MAYTLSLAAMNIMTSTFNREPQAMENNHEHNLTLAINASFDSSVSLIWDGLDKGTVKAFSAAIDKILEAGQAVLDNPPAKVYHFPQPKSKVRTLQILRQQLHFQNQPGV